MSGHGPWPRRAARCRSNGAATLAALAFAAGCTWPGAGAAPKEQARPASQAPTRTAAPAAATPRPLPHAAAAPLPYPHGDVPAPGAWPLTCD